MEGIAGALSQAICCRVPIQTESVSSGETILRTGPCGYTRPRFVGGLLSRAGVFQHGAHANVCPLTYWLGIFHVGEPAGRGWVKTWFLHPLWSMIQLKKSVLSYLYVPIIQPAVGKLGGAEDGGNQPLHITREKYSMDGNCWPMDGGTCSLTYWRNISN